MQENFTKEDIIDLMKKTRKTDPLFKPLKKLKTAVENIGIEAISFVPTERVIVFHFGLGNQIDNEFVLATKPHNLRQDFRITPGHSYCILYFQNKQAAQEYIKPKSILYGKPVYFQYIEYQNLSRILIFLYCKEHFLAQSSLLQVNNCPLSYQEGCVPGLIIVQNVIDRQEQGDLLLKIDEGSWVKLNNRRVQHFGYQFKYGSNQIDKNDQKGIFPQFLNKLLNKIYQIPQLKGLQFDQLTINDYFPGDGIPAHFDTHSPFEEIFISFSILSGIVMDFKKYNGQERLVYLKQRSLAIFSGQARYAWTHAISSRKIDKIDDKWLHRSRRVSLTFRKIKFTPCECIYYFYCDSQGYDQQTMKKNNPLLTAFLSKENKKQLQRYNSQQIQRQFVEKAYNSFGFDFHNKVIKQIREYLQNQVCAGDMLVDIGCGNGQYKKWIRGDCFYFAVQKCRMMVRVQNQFYMDCVKLGFRSNSFDKVLLVAVLHHLASEEKRVKALMELKRIMKDDGIAYVSVLNYQSKKQIYKSPEIFLQYCLPANKIPQKERYMQNIMLQGGIIEYQEPTGFQENILKHSNKPLSNINIVQMQRGRKQQRGQVFKRYYHLFSLNQLQCLLSKAQLKIIEFKLTQQNIIVKIRKIFNDHN